KPPDCDPKIVNLIRFRRIQRAANSRSEFGDTSSRWGGSHTRSLCLVTAELDQPCWEERGPASLETVPELPTIVVVGRPNVGKSPLFNAILGQRRSIVGDEPGITRDRIHGEAEYQGRRFELIDTGGIITNDDELIPSQILKQARTALQRASH